MRVWQLWMASVAFGATATMALQSKGTMPDPTVTYHQRQNCHGAYDLLNADLDAGIKPSDADIAWSRTHEDAATAGKPCPPPPPALAKRASNRMVVTRPGLKMVGSFSRQKDPTAYFEIGNTVLYGKVPGMDMTPQDGFNGIQLAAQLGDAHANFVIGSLYMAGIATGKPDYAGAFPFVERAAKAGHLDAVNLLGSMYVAGLGTRKDGKLGFDHLSKAAANGHVLATYMVASMTLNGDGAKKDVNLAYRLARNLADQGEVSGAIIAASALLQQKNNDENEKEVLYWMDLARRDGDATVRAHVDKLRPQIVSIYKRVNAPPEYRPRVRKLCPMKTVCYVSAYTGARQSCTTNKDYWNDCNL